MFCMTEKPKNLTLAAAYAEIAAGRSIEADARARRAGLWADERSIEPWVWRRERSAVRPAKGAAVHQSEHEAKQRP